MNRDEQLKRKALKFNQFKIVAEKNQMTIFRKANCLLKFHKRQRSGVWFSLIEKIYSLWGLKTVQFSTIFSSILIKNQKERPAKKF